MLEFFSGEIWHTQYGLDVLEATLAAMDRGLFVGQVLIPTNASFLLDEIQTCKIQRLIKKFERQGSYLAFSLSLDGLPLEDLTRPLNNTKLVRDEEFYERAFMFAKHNNFFFHPMVASVSAHKWIENYKWWMEKCEKYEMPLPKSIMTLEVRNDDWTDESIQHYCDWLKFMIDNEVSKFGVRNFTEKLFCYDPYYEGYVPFAPTKSDTFAGCTVANSLTVRVGDLAIAPCHRTAYNKYLYGWFMVENDEIIDIKANNPQMAVRILMANNTLTSLGCDTCIHRDYCLKGCYGTQIENCNDPFIPCKSVCKFFKKKYSFLINYFDEIGVLDIIKEINNPYHAMYHEIIDFLNYAEEVKNDMRVR